MTLLKIRCTTQAARDTLVAQHPGGWGGYAVSTAGYRWYAYIWER